MHLGQKFPKRPVILVSKDINMRIKARALGLEAQDYFNDKVLEDTDLLYTGTRELPADFWDTHGKGLESWKKDSRTYYRIKGPLCPEMLVNEFVWQEGPQPLQAWVRVGAGKTAELETLIDYSHAKNAVWGITARNREQNFALNLLMNPEIDFVTLLGQAGTGKTLLTLAAALTQTLETKLFAEIIITRVTVPVGEDIGFLPGTEEEKMTPWMGALEDNLDVLNKPAEAPSGAHAGGSYGGDWGRAATMDLIRSRIKVKSLNFMRGRTFLNKFLIIDEAQNLTPKQMKTLITRAGPGTKVVCLGNIAQIDTPYLTEGQFRPDLRGRSLQGLAAFRPCHAAARRALAPGGTRGRGALKPRPDQYEDPDPEAWFSKRVNSPRKVSRTVPTGPLRCLPIMASAVALVLGIRLVVFLAVHHQDDVGILFDGAGLAQVAHQRALVVAFLDLPRELRQGDDRHLQAPWPAP
jgi:predicted ribonuclease YlaK